MRLVSRSILLIPLIFLGLSAADLPTPPEADLPYLIHATSLVPVARSEASQEETKKKELIYWVPGERSGVTTPLAFPEFLFKSETIQPEALALYRFEMVNGRREVVYSKKSKVLARPYNLTLSVEDQDQRVARIRVSSTLPSGEYCLTPDGSNSVFCFTVN